jgi:DNA-binding transcriptional LysR family regulator
MLNSIDLSRADLNLLVLFETVMRERHVGRAAERLSLSPSAVSHGLGRLRALLNDPLFIKTPRGVTPSDRALALEPAIADILARVRGVVQTAAPFDPRTSTRSFTYLDARTMDVAVMPTDVAPLRFETRRLYEEDFVIAARNGHAYFKRPSLKAFCDAQHLVVSATGDAHGFVDTALAERDLSRRVALTAPNFTLALTLLTSSDLIAAVPRRFFALHGAVLGLACMDVPLKLPRFGLYAMAPKTALQDAGLAWLVGMLARAASDPAPRKRRTRRAS